MHSFRWDVRFINRNKKTGTYHPVGYTYNTYMYVHRNLINFILNTAAIRDTYIVFFVLYKSAYILNCRIECTAILKNTVSPSKVTCN